MTPSLSLSVSTDVYMFCSRYLYLLLQYKSFSFNNLSIHLYVHKIHKYEEQKEVLMARRDRERETPPTIITTNSIYYLSSTTRRLRTRSPDTPRSLTADPSCGIRPVAYRSWGCTSPSPRTPPVVRGVAGRLLLFIGRLVVVINIINCAAPAKLPT